VCQVGSLCTAPRQSVKTPLVVSEQTAAAGMSKPGEPGPPDQLDRPSQPFERRQRVHQRYLRGTIERLLGRAETRSGWHALSLKSYIADAGRYTS
jgi:hypothetical protein